MSNESTDSQPPQSRLSLLQAVCLNTSMMVGIGPFLTIPLLVTRMNGSQSLWIWAIGAAVAIADGLVWSELSAAFPGSGGTYHFYDAIYGQKLVGRLLKFLFVWQFLFSAPLELASGAIGCVKYLGFVEGWSVLSRPITTLRIGAVGSWTITGGNIAAAMVMFVVMLMAYRRVGAAGRAMVVLWIGMIGTVAWITVTGFLDFDPGQAFDSAQAWNANPEGLQVAGVALGMAMYTYLGYYQVCYLADEVETPSRTVPRSILISVLIVAAMYFAMNTALLGTLGWERLREGDAIVGLMKTRYGTWASYAIIGLIAWTALAGTFAAMVSYARVPYAASRAGHFFHSLAAIHPRGGFPHRSLLLVGAAATVACFADLETVINALMTSRILIQFVGQIATVFFLRSRPELRSRMTFRMWFFPVPAIVALAGWLYVFGASDRVTMLYGIGSIAAGGVAFLIWDRGGKSALEV